MGKVLLAFSWGHRFPEPGLSNEVMAREVLRVKDDFEHLLVQYEIAQVLEEEGVTPTQVIGEPGVYINTTDVARRAADWMTERLGGAANAETWVMCHQTHWRACKLVLRKLNISARRVPAEIPHDPLSAQWYTRGPARAFAAKFVRGVGYLLRGELF